MDNIVMILFAVFLIVNTIRKPRYFWERRKARNLRKMLGDSGASKLYLAIGVLLLLLGALSF